MKMLYLGFMNLCASSNLNKARSSFTVHIQYSLQKVKLSVISMLTFQCNPLEVRFNISLTHVKFLSFYIHVHVKPRLN